jgi:nucleoside-diphosphate-sugar epimerase
MQTILGSNGTIGTFLAMELSKYTDKIRLVSRNPQKVNPDDELISLDLLDAEKVSHAVKGSDVVYLTVGIVYKVKEWNRQWEVIMRNVIHACKKHNAKLVFFDNVYPYGKVDGWMTEETPINPCSKKGSIRARLNEMIMYDVERGNLQAIIARAADFYGPNTPLSFVNVMVIENYLKGKKAQWMLDDSKKHSLTYTPDAAKATALLGNTETAYNQLWHLPIDKNALTGREFMELAAKACGVEPKYTILKKWMIQMAGMFNHNIKETVEMLYQLDSDYLFDSTKFDKAFNFKTTTYKEGIDKTIQSYK